MKDKFLVALNETRKREAELVALCSDAAPDPSGHWHPKDHLAHMSDSREREAQLIEAVRTGAEPPPDSGPEHNDAFYQENRNQPSAEVIAGASRSWDHLTAAIEACTEEDFERPRPYSKDRKLVEGSPADHLAAHIFWCHIEVGDEKAAEAILRWAQDLSSRTTTDPRSRGVAAYNLACFYGRTGRAEDAAPILREALELSPDLRAWSHKDPDLDPIRDDPRIVEVLAGVGSGEAVS